MQLYFSTANGKFKKIAHNLVERPKFVTFGYNNDELFSYFMHCVIVTNGRTLWPAARLSEWCCEEE